jgi:quinol monooxygenase YgiN
MLLVTLEARVSPEQEKTLTRAYAHAMRRRPAGIVQSFLTQDSVDPTVWRIYTIWKSREALEAHYRSDAPMPSAYAFHLAGLIPVGMTSEIVTVVDE